MKIYALQLKQKSTADVSNGIFRNFRTATLENMYFFLGGGEWGWGVGSFSKENRRGEGGAVIIMVSGFYFLLGS